MSVRTMIASALLILAAAAPALAADKPNVREACRQDVEQLCPGVQAGGGRIMQCLRDHADKVSDGCKQAFQAARRQAGPVNVPSTGDRGQGWPLCRA